MLPEESPRVKTPKTIRPDSLAVQQQSRSVRKFAKKPVVIYAVSPKIIEVQASEFRSMVQRLTGLESSASCSGELGDRMSGERESPSKAEGIKGEGRSGLPVQKRRASSDQLSSWKSFFANAKDSNALPDPSGWLLEDET